MDKGPRSMPGSILLVDDDENLQALVSVMLRSNGYDVASASNALEALDRLDEAIPDLIISDVTMPGMDGFTFLRELRKDPFLKSIPVLMLTARGSVDDIVSGLEQGADDYLPKPFLMPELLARVRARVLRPPVPSDSLGHDRQTGLLSEKRFVEETHRELRRSQAGDSPGCLAFLALSEMDLLRERYGQRAAAELALQLSSLLRQNLRDLDVAGRDREGFFMLLLPEVGAEECERILSALAGKVMAHSFAIGDAHVHLTPAAGYTLLDRSSEFETLREQALTALDQGTAHLDLQPKRYQASAPLRAGSLRAGPGKKANLPWRTPAQLLLTLLLGWLFPFLLYRGFDALGYDISGAVYLIVVVALVITSVLIWTEGFLALKRVDPPAEPASPYPPATAVIAAYLPNEALTIVETVEAFLRLEYPAPLQVILAYATPSDLPIESILKEMAAADARFLPLRIPNSGSKAQSVNAALSGVTGTFVGIFDADHHPDPRNFMRAWRWLAEGYDVVQGHCVVRNGGEAWVAETVAVEFEGIYAVSHPGRARLYDFGIFGGSNGYWRTDLLRQTRLRGSMLTEDIDSSMRVTEAGYRILSDPQLISRELAPLTLKALWNQRMRWAQGWYQVSLRHLRDALRSRTLSPRQKFGIFWLLGWREIFPWISLQILPLICFWAVKYGGLDRLDWLIPIFVLTSLFTFSVGPGQTLFAYLLSVPEIRKHRRWFPNYLFRSMFFYTEYKNTIGRIAQVKELMGERKWLITPRDRSASKLAETS